MADKQFSFYPVDNGQSVSMATLDSDSHLLCDIKQNVEGCSDDEKCVDVRAELLTVLPKRNGRHYLSVFALSHCDRDHCQGFERVFHLPSGPDDEELIDIDEMWVTARIFQEKELDGSAKEVQRQAKRPA